jgi:hypothetical protein
VLIGGCAIYLLTRDHFPHRGIEDIDFALKTKIPPKHETIREIIERLDSIPSGSAPHKFSKHTTSHVDGEEYLIELDFLCEKRDLERANGPRYYHAVQKDLHAVPYSGVSIAFDFNLEREIRGVSTREGTRPDTVNVN